MLLRVKVRALTVIAGALAFALAFWTIRALRVRRAARRPAAGATAPSARLASGKPPPSALPPSPAPPKPRPPYLDTDAQTLEEQRDALFTNMANQLDLSPSVLNA